MNFNEAKETIKDELFNAAQQDQQEGQTQDAEAAAYRNGLRFALRILSQVEDVDTKQA